MKDDFDKIIQRLLSEMPQHTPKSDAWLKINEKLDQELSLSRMREILKNTEHAPKQELWANIETALDKSLVRPPFYSTRFFKISLSSFIIVSTVVLLFLFNNKSSSNDRMAQTDHRRLNEKSIITGGDSPTLNENKIVPVSYSSHTDNQGSSEEKIVKDNFRNKTENNSDFVNNDNTKNSSLANNSENLNNVSGVNENAIQAGSEKDVAATINTYSSKSQSDEIILAFVKHLTCSSVPYIFDSKLSKAASFAPGTVNWGNPAQGMSEGNLSLEFSYTPEAAFSSFYSTTSADYNLHMDMRSKAEFPGLSYTAGVEAKMDFRHWFFQSGINFSKNITCAKYKYQNNKFDTLGWVLFDTSFVPQSIDSTSGGYDTIPAHFIYSWNPVTGVITTSETKKAVAEIQYIQIPLLAGYSISSKHFIYSLATGVSIGIPVSVKGEVLSLDNSGLTEMSQLKSRLRQPVFNLLIRAGASYVVNSHYSVSLQPSLRYSLNSLYNKTYPVGQRQALFGARFGLVYRF
jgi:hypothetical protein